MPKDLFAIFAWAESTKCSIYCQLPREKSPSKRSNPKLLKQIDDILELIAQLSDSPTPELIERFENHVLFFEGRRAKIYDISPEAA